MGRSTVPESVVSLLIERGEVGNLSFNDALQIQDALDRLKAVDPACGSGAYLLGLLQEVLQVYRHLYSQQLRSDARSIYDLKQRIIRNSLYGVDLDQFAVNIAMLRLWLSLAVETDSPLPLPNLDFKIECGDSLTGPNPREVTQYNVFAQTEIERFEALKTQYANPHYDGDRKELRAEIDKLRKHLGDLSNSTSVGNGFDWIVEFAEVFVTRPSKVTIGGELNLGQELAPIDRTAGFDIVLANPPYVRQGLIGSIKPQLKTLYPEVFTGTSDLYVFFYARAIQLLRPGGMLAFISSNKWFRARYGTKLRESVSRSCRVRSITDFGDLPVFESATAYPMIFLAQKAMEQGEFFFTNVKSLDPPYPNVLALTRKDGNCLPGRNINGSDWHLVDDPADKFVRTLIGRGTLLSNYIHDRIYRGILTGLNKAFIIDDCTRSALIQRNERCKEVIKPLVIGREIKRWHCQSNASWIIVTHIGIDMSQYPAIFEHLSQWKRELIDRQDQGNHWWELRSCDYYEIYEGPKIMWGNMGLEPRFAYSTVPLYTVAPANTMPVDDFFLLGLLNSEIARRFFQRTAIARGGNYLEFKPMYVKQFPVPVVSKDDKKAIELLVAECIAAKGQGCECQEHEIDSRVAGIFGLND